MALRVLLYSFFLLINTTLQAQNQANRWYFGDQFGLDFSSGAPVPVFDGALFSFEGCVSYSDEFGLHLFYSNGGGRDLASGQPPGLIWNREHDVMYDMSFTEGGGFSAQQSSLVVPNPASPGSQYYLFTMEEAEFDVGGSVPGQPEGRGLSYFLIDMELNGGLGEVIIADERVEVPLYEQLSGTQHSNQMDYWVMVVDNNTLDNNRIGVVGVSATGVTDVVWYPTAVGSNYGGNLKIAPNGQYIALNFQGEGISIFPFDNTTGEVDIANEIYLPIIGGGAIAYSFSPNNQYLYYRTGAFTSEGAIERFDLLAPDIPGSQETIATYSTSFSGPGQMQLGPDGNIYFLDAPFTSMTNPIHRITCPNSAFPSVEIELLNLPPGPTMGPTYGLPNFMDHIFESYEEGGIIDIGPDTLLLCSGNSFTIGSESSNGGYEWNTGATTPFITISEAGTYILNAEGVCGPVTDTLVAISSEAGSVTILGPELICDGEPIELIAQTVVVQSNSGWVDNPGSDTLLVTTPGVYEYQFTDACGEANSIIWEVNEAVSPVVALLPGSLEPFCNDTPLLLTAELNTEATILWSTGATESQITVEEEGTYFLTAENACGFSSDTLEVIFSLCECELELPTAFTPNMDGVNDSFGLLKDCELINDYQLMIYNRWGQMVFESSDPGEKWDGSFQGEPGIEDVYVWKMYLFLEGDEEGHTTSGEITLLR